MRWVLNIFQCSFNWNVMLWTCFEWYFFIIESLNSVFAQHLHILHSSPTSPDLYGHDRVFPFQIHLPISLHRIKVLTNKHHQEDVIVFADIFQYWEARFANVGKKLCQWLWKIWIRTKKYDAKYIKEFEEFEHDDFSWVSKHMQAVFILKLCQA